MDRKIITDYDDKKAHHHGRELENDDCQKIMRKDKDENGHHIRKIGYASENKADEEQKEKASCLEAEAKTRREKVKRQEE